MTEFWEPWTPTTGQRVRYILKHECPGVMGVQWPEGHPQEFDQQPGVMYEVLGGNTSEARSGHRFLVRLDSGRRIACAALELAPEQ